MQRRAHEYVEENYAELKRCLRAYGQFARAGAALAGQVQNTGESESDGLLRARTEYKAARRALLDTVTASRQALTELGPLPGLVGESVVRFGAETAASLAEVLVKHCERTAQHSRPAAQVGPEDKEQLFWLFQLTRVRDATDDHPEFMLLDIRREEAELDKEAARVSAHIQAGKTDVEDLRHGLWLYQGKRVELLGNLDSLDGNTRELLCLLIRAQGRRVEYAEIGESIWGDQCAPGDRIQDTKRRLAEKLKELGHPEIVDAIRSLRNAYLLDLP